MEDLTKHIPKHEAYSHCALKVPNVWFSLLGVFAPNDGEYGSVSCRIVKPQNILSHAESRNNQLSFCTWTNVPKQAEATTIVRVSIDFGISVVMT